ncbi:MAG: LamG-like jellyroll fold domain-containing protein, partial [Promethearchaeota archaeon]
MGLREDLCLPDPLDSNFMTVSAWIYSTRLDLSWHTIAQRNNDIDNWYDWQLYARAQDSPSGFRAVVRINFDEDYVADEEAESDIVLSTNTWYYIAATYDKNQMRFFRDGSLTDTYSD